MTDTTNVKEIENWYLLKHKNAEALAKKVENLLKDIFLFENIHFHAVFSRVKGLDSCQEKYKKNGYTSTDDFTDLVGVRVITYVLSDVEVIRKRITQLFEIKELLDKSKQLKKNEVGYQSIHMICSFDRDRLAFPEYQRFTGDVFEIQIRTILQHAWAEIEHDRRYKISSILPDEIDRSFALLAATLELSDNEFNRIATKIDAKKSRISTAGEKEPVKYKMFIPLGAKKSRLQEVARLLKRNPGSDTAIAVVPPVSAGGNPTELTLPYKIKYTKELWQQVSAILNSDFDEIPF